LLGIVAVLERGDDLRSDQFLLPMSIITRHERDLCTLTVNNQSRYICSIASDITTWIDFEDVERTTTEGDQVGREVSFGGESALKHLRVVDTTVLRNSGGNSPESGLGQSAENSGCGIHQGQQSDRSGEGSFS